MNDRRCAICWDDLAACFPAAETHHIIPRGRCRGRKGWDSAANKIRLCGICHGVLHGRRAPQLPDLDMSHVIAAKLESDMAHADLGLLRRLNGHDLPDVQEIPAEYLKLREQNRSLLWSY